MPWTMKAVRAPHDYVWSRWKQGEAFSEIGRAVGVSRQAIRKTWWRAAEWRHWRGAADPEAFTSASEKRFREGSPRASR
jgi:hypothetical protein